MTALRFKLTRTIATLLIVSIVISLSIPVTSASAATPVTDFRNGMRKLWEDHITWTRLYIISAAADLPDKDQTAQRLLQNQADIGNAVKPFYGQAAGDKLTDLLKQHIAIAVDLIKAAKGSDQGAFAAADRKWKQNASVIADFLAKANPNWPARDLADAMNMHLETTTREVVARLQHKYDDDVAAFDAIYEHILHMADVLSDGIVKQFPEKFAA